MSRTLRIALLVLVVVSFVGTVYALSATPDLAQMTESHTPCSEPCLSSGEYCFSASDCPDVRNLEKACCANQCVYCF